MSFGIRTDPTADQRRRLAKLFNNIQSSIPGDDARYGAWLHFARGWAELTLLVHELVDSSQDEAIQNLKNLQMQVDATFLSWLVRRYAGLINLPPIPPIMLHHLPRFLSRLVEEDRNSKVALLLVDGLSYDQWLVVRESIGIRRPEYVFRENAVFSWISTIT